MTKDQKRELEGIIQELDVLYDEVKKPSDKRAISNACCDLQDILG